MPYTLVKSFEKGIDTRKLLDTTEAGALLDARDCHITLGGELEKRAAFVVMGTLPSTTVGLWVTEGRVYHTWGTAATPPAGLPAGTVYHPIPEPVHGTPLVRILSVEEFSGDLYVIAQYADEDVVHWWKDAPVTIPPPPPVETEGGGEAETPTASTPENKPQVSLTLLPAIYLSGITPTEIEIYHLHLVAPSSTYNFGPSGTIDAYSFLTFTGTRFDRPAGSVTVTYTPGPTGGAAAAAALQDECNFVSNALTAQPKLFAQAGTGGSILFWVDVASPLYNGWRIEVRGGALREAIGTLSGGVTPTGGTLYKSPGLRSFPEEVGMPMDLGTFAIAHNYRMFSVQSSKLRFSETKDPAVWTDSVLGALQIDHTMVTNRAPVLVSMADYGGDLAVFGLRHVFIWHIEVNNPDQDFKRQTIHGTGTFAPHSVTPWGQTDVMYLDISGIRSLRARDSSEQAFAADLGNMIDELVKEKVATLTDNQKKFNVWGIVEPRSGRLWMAMLNKFFVLSFYPTSRIAAWTWYDATSAPVDYMNSSDDTVYWRSGNNIMAYGGIAGDTYDATEALARVPYIDAGKPATSKNWTGLDAAIYGTWEVRGSFDPTIPTALDLLANITKSTYQQQKIAVNGESPALSLELKTTFIGPARIGNASLHYTDSTAD
jgi:hypothetical protein